MGSSTIRDILTAFSPSLDFFAISAGDGRIKIWDALKGQVQTEFADISPSDAINVYPGSVRGHLSIDYTCMKWLSIEGKRKRKHQSSLLVLGTGSGDVLALDVSAGQLHWRASDCHPGGVNAISSIADGSSIYTAGADGMVCKIDFVTGNLLEKFKASTKAISCMSVSSDGKIIATASAQLKISRCSDHKKIQKFSGHPGPVRCMVFTEDGKYVLSSAVGERYIALWKIDDNKKQSACCFLSMDHPSVFLDSKCIGDSGDNASGINVLAISETGVCYFWHGKNIEELRNAKPSKVSVSLEDSLAGKYKGALPAIYAAKLMGIPSPTTSQLFLAYGLLVKPSFKKLIVHSASDVKLNVSNEGILLPKSHTLIKSHKSILQNRVRALDRANAEDALLPVSKVFDPHDKKDYQGVTFGARKGTDKLLERNTKMEALKSEDEMVEDDGEVVCIEERLRSLGILNNENDVTPITSPLLHGINLETDTPKGKIRAAVLSMVPSEAYTLLELLVSLWQSRLCSGKYIVPWIYGILINHGSYIMSHEHGARVLNSLSKIVKGRSSVLQPLLQLSGRLQIVITQIDKASRNKSQIDVQNSRKEGSEDEEDDDDDQYFNDSEDDVSEISSDDSGKMKE